MREISSLQLDAWHRLRKFYQPTYQWKKLEEIYRATIPLFFDSFAAKEGMVESFVSLNHFDKAKWWILHLREEVKPQTPKYLSVIMQLSRLSFMASKPDEGNS